MRYFVESQIEKNTKVRENAYSEIQTREAEAVRNENYPSKYSQACQKILKGNISAGKHKSKRLEPENVK